MTDRITRRRLVKIAGGTVLASLAGCTSSGGGASDATATPTSTPTATPTETTHGGDSHHHEEGGHHDGTTTGGHHEEHGGHHDGTTTGGHEHHGGHHHDLPEEPSSHAEVTMITTDDGGYHFSPHLAWVKPGGTVTWHLESGSHTTTAYAPANDRPRRIPTAASAWDSGTLSEKGATFERTFEVEGVYDYYCIPHEAMGMLGTVVVGKPDPHEQVALEAPQASLPSKARKKIESLNEMANEVLGHHHDG